MKRVLLFGLSAVVLATSASKSFAQPQLGFLSQAYVGSSLNVTQPASIVGGKQTSNSYSSSWGGNPDTANLTNIQVVKGLTDTLACTPLTNGSAIAGKVALVFRGTCEFGAKALACQTAGAKAVIIVNNAAGAPIAMGPGAVGASVTIPVFMVTQLDGLAMNAQIVAGQTVRVSYTRWATGVANDVGITPNSIARPHAAAMPRSQMGTNNGNPLAYRNYVGAFIGNYGTAAQTNVKLRSRTMWYPAGGGAATMVRMDSVTNATFTVADSIKDAQFLSTSSYQLNPASNGEYRFIYDVSATAADGNSSNNVDSVSMTVTDSVFAKCGWNPNTGTIVVTGARGYVGNATPATIGPLFYMAKANYRAAKAQFSIAKYNASGTDPNLAGTPDVTITVYKWTDGRKNSPLDSVIEGPELRAVAIGTKTFATGDSSYETYTVNLTDYVDDTKPAVLRETGWYWVAVTTDNATQFPGVATLNYFSRSAAAERAVPSYREHWAPMVENTKTAIDTTDVLDSLSMYMFSLQGNTRITNPYTDAYSAAYTYTNTPTPPSQDYCPATALHISKDTVAVPTTSVPSVGTSAFEKLDIFPNPAKEALQISYSLAEATSRLTFHVMNAMGQRVKLVEVADPARSGTAKISTADLAAGQYYLLVGYNGKIVGRTFTVVGK